MNSTQLKYRRAMTKIGAILLIFSGLLLTFMSVYMFIPTDSLPEPLSSIVDSILYDLAYLGAFMLPVLFVPLFFREGERQPMRLEPKISVNVFALILVGVAFTHGFSYINSSLIEAVFGQSTVDEIFNYGKTSMSDTDIVLQFITIAIVPGFCEEFLFRGVVLSNLTPYGKSTAIIVSSVCFGLMHGNFYQFLYTTVAGIILGTVYVLTDSIWPSTIIHIMNNALSLLQTVMFERMAEDYAYMFWLMIEGIIIVGGLVCFVILAKKYKSDERYRESVFGRELTADLAGKDAGLWGHCELDAKGAVKAFFAPTIIAFVSYVVLEALAALTMV